MGGTAIFDDLKPWPTIAPADLAIVRHVYEHSTLSAGPIAAGQLRYDLSCSRDAIQHLVQLELLQSGGDGLESTVLGLLYLPEAEDDLRSLAQLVELAHQRYVPPQLTIPKADLASRPELRVFRQLRLQQLAGQLRLYFDTDGGLRVSEGNWDTPTFRDAFLKQYRNRFENAQLHEGPWLNAAEPLPFAFRLTRLTTTRFRVLNDVDVRLGPLTILVGPNGVGKSTLLDSLAFLRTATNRSLKAAVADEGGLDRLRTRGSEGPLRLAVEFSIDHGHGPIPCRYEIEFAGLAQHVVVEHETLVVGSHVLLDKRRGHTRIRQPDGTIEDVFESAGELGLQTARPAKDSAVLAGVRSALGQTVLVDRDPVLLAPDEYAAAFGHSGRNRRARHAVNLTTVLSSIASDPESVDKLSRVIAEILPNIERVDAEPITGEAPELAISMVGVIGTLGVDELSSGTRQILLLAALYAASVRPQLVLLEEPDAGIHPSRQAALVHLLRSLSQSSVVIATTHSPAFVSRLSSTDEVKALSFSDSGPSIDNLADVVRSRRWLQAFGDVGEAFARGSGEL